MTPNIRNEISIELAGETRTLRATFTALRSIERDLRLNLIPLVAAIGRGDLGVEQAAIIIHHGLQGFDDRRLTFDQVGQAVMEKGVTALMEPIVDFLAVAMEGVTMGKPVEAA